MNTPAQSDLLAQIAQVRLMERGKLSAYTFKDRSTQTPYHKLQSWEKGKNVTRYIPSEQVALVEEALAGHAKFRELVEQYAQTVIEQTRQQLAAVGIKKKNSRPNSSWPSKRRSSN